MRRLLPLLALIAQACATVSTPALKHETGETLGSRRVRIGFNVERSRLYPVVDSRFAANGVEQKQEVFVGTLMSAQAAVGVAQNFDLGVGNFFSSDGGGWRLSAKRQIFGRPASDFKDGQGGQQAALSVLVGYSALSGSGTVTYLTNSFPSELKQTLSSKLIEISAPASYRFSQAVVVYGGLNYYHAIVQGSSDIYAVSDVSNDFGANLGIRFAVSALRLDFEAAFVRIHDPFLDEMRTVPFYGAGVALGF